MVCGNNVKKPDKIYKLDMVVLWHYLIEEERKKKED